MCTVDTGEVRISLHMVLGGEGLEECDREERSKVCSSDTRGI